jgi:FkbM family methyltransferase
VLSLFIFGATILNLMSRLRAATTRHPRILIVLIYFYARLHKFQIKLNDTKFTIISDNRQVTLRRENLVYSKVVIDDFESYFGSVAPEVSSDGILVADFSTTRSHKLSGFEIFEVELPGLPEPMSTVTQYLELTGMKLNDVVLDLGAYAGVTGMSFSDVVGKSGRVISVEADPINYNCAENNFRKYFELFGYSPELVKGAIYSDNKVLQFASEGGLGSAIASVQTRSTGPLVEVNALTLMDLVHQFDLSKVDVVKADIEGAEYAAFSNREFFNNFHPRIIFEPAMNHMPETSLESLILLLESYGYKCSIFKQIGSRLPLVLAD